MNRLTQSADGSWYYAKPEPTPVPELSDSDRRQLVEDAVDKLAAVLVQERAMDTAQANLLASRRRDLIHVEHGRVGTIVTIRDRHGARYPASNPDAVRQIAHGIALDAERAAEEAARKSAPLPTSAELFERTRRQLAADPSYGSL